LCVCMFVHYLKQKLVFQIQRNLWDSIFKILIGSNLYRKNFIYGNYFKNQTKMEFIQKNWIKMMKCRKKNQQKSSLNIPLVEMKQFFFKLQQLYVQLHWIFFFNCSKSLKQTLFTIMLHITQNNSNIILINYRQCDFTIS
jgi:hypothetical protein